MESEGGEDEDEAVSGWGDEVVSGWGESGSDEEAEQQAESMVPVSLPRLVALSRQEQELMVKAAEIQEVQTQGALAAIEMEVVGTEVTNGDTLLHPHPVAPLAMDACGRVTAAPPPAREVESEVVTKLEEPELQEEKILVEVASASPRPPSPPPPPRPPPPPQPAQLLPSDSPLLDAHPGRQKSPTMAVLSLSLRTDCCTGAGTRVAASVHAEPSPVVAIEGTRVVAAKGPLAKREAQATAAVVRAAAALQMEPEAVEVGIEVLTTAPAVSAQHTPIHQQLLRPVSKSAAIAPPAPPSPSAEAAVRPATSTAGAAAQANALLSSQKASPAFNAPPTFNAPAASAQGGLLPVQQQQQQMRVREANRERLLLTLVRNVQSKMAEAELPAEKVA